jgi:acetoin utilization protein AcuC
MQAPAALVWRPDLAAYDLGEGHPLDPVRLQLSVALMRDYDMLPPGAVLVAPPASNEDLLRVHSAEYLDAVRKASSGSQLSGFGLGTADNPVFRGMHDTSALICGASIRGLDAVLGGGPKRTFSIAGGLHHAHRARAAGFCVYNDPAVAIAHARAARPGLRVLYLDIDAHHGDGVQEAFYDSAEVMTVSLHETGEFLFPGTGTPGEIGEGAGVGYAANVPLPPYATDDCYRLAFDRLVVPLARSFRPEVIVAQLGINAHHDDPLTQLALTIPGYRALVRWILQLADELCDGRVAALGGGGYDVYRTVPRAWAWVMGFLLDAYVPEELPDAWRDRVRPLLREEPPCTLGADDGVDLPPSRAQRVYEQTAEVVDAALGALAPYHARLR